MALTNTLRVLYAGQAVFALVSPGNVLSNLVAGAIAEAGVYTLLCATAPPYFYT